jgi:hypothetical protein
MIARTSWPCAVSLMIPVAKMVAHTSFAARKLMMSTAGSMRPPMSNVSATPAPASGMVANVWSEPAGTRSLAVQPVAVGADACGGGGVTLGSPATRSTQPGSITFGSSASEG